MLLLVFCLRFGGLGHTSLTTHVIDVETMDRLETLFSFFRHLEAHLRVNRTDASFGSRQEMAKCLATLVMKFGRVRIWLI